MKKNIIFLCFLFTANMMFSQTQATLNKLFIKELENRNYEKMERLLAKGAEIDHLILNTSKDPYSTLIKIEQESPLMLAIKYKDKKLIDFLLDKGADVNVGVKEKLFANNWYNYEKVNIEYVYRNKYPINYALQYSERDFIMKLLNKGADPSVGIFSLIENWDSRTLLEEFVKRGADLKTTQRYDFNGNLQTPFSHCLKYNRSYILDFLFEQNLLKTWDIGFFSNAVRNKKYKMMSVFISHTPSIFNDVLKYGKSPLCIAIEKNDLSLFHYLEGLGFKQEGCTCKGKSLVDYAASVKRRYSPRGVSEKFMDYLLYGEFKELERQKAPKIDSTLDCTAYKEGTFVFNTKNSSSVIVRNNKYQLEFITKNGIWFLYHIEWINKNTYKITKVKTNDHVDVDSTQTQTFQIVSGNSEKHKLYDFNYKYKYSFYELQRNYKKLPKGIADVCSQVGLSDVLKVYKDPKELAKDNFYNGLKGINCYTVEKSAFAKNVVKSYVWRYAKDMQISYTPSKKQWSIYQLKWNRTLRFKATNPKDYHESGNCDVKNSYIGYKVGGSSTYDVGEPLAYTIIPYDYTKGNYFVREYELGYSSGVKYFLKRTDFNNLPQEVQKELIRIKNNYENKK